MMQSAPDPTSENLQDAVENLLYSLERHRLVFLYSADAICDDPRQGPRSRLEKHNVCGWGELTSTSNDWDSEGHFLFDIQRHLNEFAQQAISLFEAKKGLAMWQVVDCKYLDKSSDSILAACMNVSTFVVPQIVSDIFSKARSVIHDDGDWCWQLLGRIRWKYFQELEEAIAEVRRSKTLLPCCRDVTETTGGATASLTSKSNGKSSEAEKTQLVVFDEDTQHHCFFDTMGLSNWGPIHTHEKIVIGDSNCRKELRRTLYRHPSNHWTLLTEIIHWISGRPQEVRTKRLTDEQAGEWFLKHGIKLPEDVGHLVEGLRFPPGAPSDFDGTSDPKRAIKDGIENRHPTAGDPNPFYVTIAQAAELSRTPKSTLDDWKAKRKLPTPAVPHSGQRPAKWDWRVLRPALENLTGLELPECPLR